jgi:RimJ/RimL family protein N-acetyltransferase
MKKNISVTDPLNNVVFLKGKKVILRPVSEKDIPLFLRWLNDPEVRQYIANILPVTEGGEREYIQGLAKKSDTDIVLVIEVKGRPIGVMGLHRINWQSRTAVTGAIIGEKDCWNKGYGTDAKMALLGYAFNTLNLRKIMSSVKAFNERSVAYSLHCGYQIEGRLRDQHFVNGCYCDEIILGLFKEQWLAAREKYLQKKR